jgi:hypothetical protein
MQQMISACGLGLALAVAGIAAHHSIAGIYDSSRQVTIDGVIAQFHFVNPHPFIMVDVKNDSGRTQQWRLEMDNRYELAGVGMKSDTLKAGDQVRVSGSPGRSQPQSLYIRRLERRPDGFWYEQVGSSPRIGMP